MDVLQYSIIHNILIRLKTVCNKLMAIASTQCKILLSLFHSVEHNFEGISKNVIPGLIAAVRRLCAILLQTQILS